jgi:hypothetical protein
MQPPHTSLAKAILSVSNITFAYAGHVAFFSFMNEFKSLKDFHKVLFLLQTVDTSIYVIVAVVVYRYTDAKVASPVLRGTEHILMKVAYGFAPPTVSSSYSFLAII